MKVVLCCLLLALEAIIGGEAVATITTVTGDTGAMLGNDAVFSCIITGTQGIGENMLFSRLNPTVSISQDSLSTNATKWVITDLYTLTITGVIMGDEGDYSCTMASDSRTFVLTVSDPPTNASLYWPGGANYTTEGEQADLTCESGASYPAATFRWFKGTANVTSDAVYTSGTANSTGYATATSVLSVTPTSDDEGVVYTCHVDVPGGTSVIQKTLAVSFSGVANVIANFSLVALLVLLGSISL